MAASNNKRIYYAVQQVGIKGDGDTGAFTALHGVQTLSMTTNFNLTQAFEYGQLAIYENIEEIPDVEVNLTKVLDGYPLAYTHATVDATSPTLSGRSNASCLVALAIFDDTADSATGSPQSQVEVSGGFVSSLSYNFPLEDFFTEEVSIVANDKVWANDANIVTTDLWNGAGELSFTGSFASNNDSPNNNNNVQRRNHILMQHSAGGGYGTDANGMYANPDATVLPPDVFGISSTGVNNKSNNIDFDAHLQSISISTDLGREELFELGRLGPYHRPVQFPIEVTCEITVTSTSGDMVSATEGGIRSTGGGQCTTIGNLQDRTIRVATCEGTRLYLGVKNKLASVNYSGGDTGGGQVAVTYTYTNFNDLTVLHSGDPNSNGSTWWTNRADHLVTA